MIEVKKDGCTIITAPDEDYTVKTHRGTRLFLAGGITNCPDWQSEMIEHLSECKRLTIYNPRRKDFPIHDPTASEKQIVWEYQHLQSADIISFWFSKGSLNPIVLYELGMWANSRAGTDQDKKIFIGIDPGYERTQDVIIQTKLAPYGIPPDIKTSVKDLAESIKKLYPNYPEV